MATLTPQQAEERIRRLPQALRHVLFAGATADAVFDIGTKHKLLINKTGELAGEIGNFMIGATKPNEFVGNLVTRLEVDRATAKQIADDVNKQIFAAVRTELRKLHGIEEGNMNKESGITNTGSVPTEKASNTKTPDKEDNVSSLFDDKLNFVEGEGTSTTQVKNASIETLKHELDKAVEEAPHHLADTRSSYKGADPYKEPISNDADPLPKPFPKSIAPIKEKEPPPPKKPVTPPPPTFSHIPGKPISSIPETKPATPAPQENNAPFSSSPFKKSVPIPQNPTIDLDTIANEEVSFTVIEKKNDPPPPVFKSSPNNNIKPADIPRSPAEIVSLEDTPPAGGKAIPEEGAIPTFRGFSAEKKQIEGVPQVPEHLKPAASPPPPKPLPTPPPPSAKKAPPATGKSPNSDPYREQIT